MAYSYIYSPFQLKFFKVTVYSINNFISAVLKSRRSTSMRFALIHHSKETQNISNLERLANNNIRNLSINLSLNLSNLSISNLERLVSSHAYYPLTKVIQILINISYTRKFLQFVYFAVKPLIRIFAFKNG